MQLTADIFGMPAARAHVYESSGLGAAIAAAVGLALYPDFPAAVRAMTREGRVFRPSPGTQPHLRSAVPARVPQDVCAAAAAVP